MNKTGPRIELCGATDSIFSHELQKEFLFFVFYHLFSMVLQHVQKLLSCVKGSEIAGMGFRNLFKSLKGEEGFFESIACESGK